MHYWKSSKIQSDNQRISILEIKGTCVALNCNISFIYSIPDEPWLLKDQNSSQPNELLKTRTDVS